jgi:hypothetical protein
VSDKRVLKLIRRSSTPGCNTGEFDQTTHCERVVIAITARRQSHALFGDLGEKQYGQHVIHRGGRRLGRDIPIGSHLSERIKSKSGSSGAIAA